jgi:hypothetical protein
MTGSGQGGSALGIPPIIRGLSMVCGLGEAAVRPGQQVQAP